MTRLEHVNVTVADPKATAARWSALFDWHIRWEGKALNGGYTVHVGTEQDYMALYTGPGGAGLQTEPDNSYLMRAGLNHIGIVVDDLDAMEAKIKAAGYETHSHADYEPGRRFYFIEEDGIEFEIISYA